MRSARCFRSAGRKRGGCPAPITLIGRLCLEADHTSERRRPAHSDWPGCHAACPANEPGRGRKGLSSGGARTDPIGRPAVGRGRGRACAESRDGRPTSPTSREGRGQPRACADGPHARAGGRSGPPSGGCGARGGGRAGGRAGARPAGGGGRRPAGRNSRGEWRRRRREPRRRRALGVATGGGGGGIGGGGPGGGRRAGARWSGRGGSARRSRRAGKGKKCPGGRGCRPATGMSFTIGE